MSHFIGRSIFCSKEKCLSLNTNSPLSDSNYRYKKPPNTHARGKHKRHIHITITSKHKYIHKLAIVSFVYFINVKGLHSVILICNRHETKCSDIELDYVEI